MSSEVNLNVESLAVIGIEELKRKWGWILALGIVLIILGTVAIGSAVTMTIFSVTLLGCLMIGGGVLQTIHAFACKRWSGFFIDLLAGLLYLVAGCMVIASPAEAAVALTWLIAMFLIFGGIFRIVVSLFVRYQNWVLLLLHGVINLLLGIAILNKWPLSGMWVIGLFVGIDMIFNGLALAMLGLAAKNLPQDPRIDTTVDA
jgi:uncharacterized membrane protein HdeD (DUF308 family)